ncbi:hypothetical protein [Pseudomonas sp. KnCO4]|uniref:hypothetical protein n=1 Tax=unclassified Pseudomonas TaxID=196821 RepID=UPI003877D2CC
MAIEQKYYLPKCHNTGAFMKQAKHEPKPLMAARFQAEARQVLAKRSSQGRFIDIALSKGRDIEPVGRMAG